jgi:siroheme synthase (precorrin-2 oxidase/ferrochelatase)
MNKLKGDLQRCLKMLQYVDTKMEKSGINRQRRRQFWRDFFKDGQVRKDIFDDLLKEINQI